jgi:hypothetical protein
LSSSLSLSFLSPSPPLVPVLPLAFLSH